MATIQEARDGIRLLKAPPAYVTEYWEYRAPNRPITVWIRGGRYHLAEPITFLPEDSGPVEYAAYPGEEPVLHGGVRITGWRTEDVRGATVWLANLPEVDAGEWDLRSLLVNGERRRRTRLPRRGYYAMEDVPGLELALGRRSTAVGSSIGRVKERCR